MEDTDNETVHSRAVFSAGEVNKRRLQRRNFFNVGRLRTNNSPIKIRCFSHERSQLQQRLKSPHSPLNMVSSSVIPPNARFNYRDLGAPKANWRQVLDQFDPAESANKEQHSATGGSRTGASAGKRRDEASFSPSYKRVFESNKYHIVNHKTSMHKHEMSIEVNELTPASSFKQHVVDYRTSNFERTKARPAINQEDLDNQRPHQNRFRAVRNQNNFFKRYVKNIKLSKGPRRSFHFKDATAYSRGDHQPFSREERQTKGCGLNNNPSAKLTKVNTLMSIKVENIE